MCCRHPDGSQSAPRSGEGGVALVIALLVFAISAALLVAMQRDFDLNYRRGANSFIAQQSWAYLRGAEELAALALQCLITTPTVAMRRGMTSTEVWAQPSAPYPLDEGGWLYGNLEDLQGRFNLNSLAAQPGDGEGANATARRSRCLSVCCRRWRDWRSTSSRPWRYRFGCGLDRRDNEPRLNGAEDSFYVGQQPAYRAGEPKLVSASELRAVANVTPELYLALRPLVTVWPEEPAASIFTPRRCPCCGR
jgi:general secretion pathway protein K